MEYDPKLKRNGGKIIHCDDCSEEKAVRYTGNVIYDHKTCATLQINKDPRLTAYINNATKLQCKGSNLGNNLKVDSAMAKSYGACLKPVGSGVNAKGKAV
jgi:hypothetical protein